MPNSRCGNRKALVALELLLPGSVCDEYPFITTDQGGATGGPALPVAPIGGPVSAKFVPGNNAILGDTSLDVESSPQGGDCGAFSGRCNMDSGDAVLVVPIPDLREAVNPNAMSIYAHVMPGMQAETASLFANIITNPQASIMFDDRLTSAPIEDSRHHTERARTHPLRQGILTASPTAFPTHEETQTHLERPMGAPIPLICRISMSLKVIDGSACLTSV